MGDNRRGRRDEDADVFEPGFDLGEFRHLAARYCRHLVRARLLAEPGFLDPRSLERWELSGFREGLSSARLLRLAAQDLGLLNREYLPRCGSGGVTATDPATPEGRLAAALAFLVEPRGAGPEFVEALTAAADRSERGEPVRWGELFDASELAAIRDDLDRLPHPARGWDGLADAVAGHRLVLVEGPGRREAHWDGGEIDADWQRRDRAWRLLKHLARQAGDPRCPAGESDLGVNVRGARDDLRRLLPDSLYCLIERRGGVLRLDLTPRDVRVFRLTERRYIAQV